MLPTVATDRNAVKMCLLEAISKLGNVTAACDSLHIDRSVHYRALDADPEYASAYQDALHAAGERLEAEARRRALDGVECVDGKGNVYRKYSDILLIFLLKGQFPQKYRDNITINAEQQADAVASELGMDKAEVQKALAEARSILRGK